jgi:ribonucleoside-triphosphate reductase
VNTYSISDNKIDQIVNQYDCNNGNLNPEGNVSAFTRGIQEYLDTKISIQFLKDNVPDAFDLHTEGLVHLNDLSYLRFKPLNCCIINPFDIIEKGFKSTNGVRSSPPKHLTSFIGLVYQSMVGLTQHQSGGIACGLFSYAVAYFGMKDDLSFDEIVQQLQQFVFSVNQTDASRSSTMFSSVNVDLFKPHFLKSISVFEDFSIDDWDKLDYYNTMVIKALCKVCYDGDSRGNIMLFPNLVFNISDESDLDDYPEIFDLTAKFYSPYFNNVKAYGDEYKTVMGCRSALTANWKRSGLEDCFGTGNLVYSTVNLPMLALKSVSINDFYDLIDSTFNTLVDYSLFRYNHIKDLSSQGLFSYHDQFYNIENGSLVIGTLGLSEAVEILSDSEFKLSSVDGYSIAEDILLHCSNLMKEYRVKHNLRFALFSPPSESACNRLAKKARNSYGHKESHVHGTGDGVFYTNGVNLPVGDGVDLVDRIRFEDGLSAYCTGGNIISLHMGETYSDPTALMSLAKKIIKNSNVPFFAFSGVYSICDQCDTKYNVATDVCMDCGSSTTTYDRVTGYIVPLKRWNKGKLSEQEERYRY